VGVSYGVHSVDILETFNPLMIANNVTVLHQFLKTQINTSKAA
jgi:phosphoglycolate phosphatase